VVFDVAARRPSGGMARYVERYVGYHLEGFPPGVHRGLPSRRLTVVVSLAGPVEMRLPGRYEESRSVQAFVAGLDTQPALIHHDGSHHGVAVDLTPAGARALLGLPAGELTGEVVELGDLLGARGRELPERLLEVDGWDARFDALEGVLARGLRDAAGVPAGVEEALARLVAGGAAVDVDALAKDVGWTRRHLTKRFRLEVGLPPRQLARALRLQRCCRLLRRGDLRTFTEVAIEAGYYDHAHMLHDWRSLAGCTPAQWLREEIPSVQDRLDTPEAE
jgi:AraC-like DNA-binding protein